MKRYLKVKDDNSVQIKVVFDGTYDNSLEDGYVEITPTNWPQIDGEYAKYNFPIWDGEKVVENTDKLNALIQQKADDESFSEYLKDKEAKERKRWRQKGKPRTYKTDDNERKQDS